MNETVRNRGVRIVSKTASQWPPGPGPGMIVPRVWALACLCGILVGLAGCASRPALQVPREDWGGAGYAALEGDTLTVLEEPEAGDDDLGVLVDSLNTPSFEIDVPDIPDSVAAATQAQLATADEIFDYPVVINRRVLTYVEQFTGKSRGSFGRSLYRSGRYLPMSRAIFAEHGIPQDLAFLAHVESGFRHNALSRARALGLWQFMRGTARDYGLRCDAYVDERLDPVKATHAAARYLKVLYERYGDWYLALAAYNAGPGKVNTAIRRAETRDFWELAKTRYLRAETQNFVPAILAATILAKSPGDYGFAEETDVPIASEAIAVDTPTDLRIVAQCAGVALETLQELNPALRQLHTPPDESLYVVHVPPGTADRAQAALAEIPPDQRLVFHRHKVRGGDTLGRLARQYGTSVAAIQDANNMGRRTLIHVGKILLVPTQSATVGLAGASGGRGPSSVEPRVEETTYTVRRGDSLISISRRFGVSVPELQERNGLGNPNQLVTDQRIVIPANAAPLDGPAEVPGVAQASSPADMPPSADEASVATPAETDAPARPATELSMETPPLDPWALADSVDSETDLGRTASTAHLIEQARAALEAEAAAAAASGATAEAAMVSEAPRPAAAGATYRVRKGDSLWGIARRHGITLEQLRSWNGLGRSAKIHPGQRLRVSTTAGSSGGQQSSEAERLHVVSRGDTLWSIARKYGVSVADLAAWNGISTKTTLHPGQRIRVL